MQTQGQSLIQAQRLKMSPQMLQSIRIMSLPIIDLKTRIEQELNENPALESRSKDDTISYDSIQGSPDQSSEENYFSNSSDPGYTAPPSAPYNYRASNANQQFIESALSKPENLHEHLISQLHVQSLSEERVAIGEILIYNLDENGFHMEEPETLFSAQDRLQIRDIKALIQKLDPLGCCTADFRESLEVQALQIEGAPEILPLIIRHHLDDLQDSKIKALARSLSVLEDEVLESERILRNLTPFPGQEYSQISADYLIPDVWVRRVDGELKIIVNDEEIPSLEINDTFNRLAKVEESKSGFIASHVRNAQWFIDSVRLRQESLRRTAVAIVEYQRDFFINGPKAIVPLTQRDIADELGLHETTISRLTRGKYMQTDFGIFELKYFFTNAVQGARRGGGNYGKVAVVAILKEILDEFGSVSDKKLSEILSDRGINIARRTVAKYRKELNISSSYKR